jgi:hypothetical protein
MALKLTKTLPGPVSAEYWRLDDIRIMRRPTGDVVNIQLSLYVNRQAFLDGEPAMSHLNHRLDGGLINLSEKISELYSLAKEQNPTDWKEATDVLEEGQEKVLT